MNPSDKNPEQPEPSEQDLKIEDLAVEDSPDAQGENVKGGFEATGRIDHIRQI